MPCSQMRAPWISIASPRVEECPWLSPRDCGHGGVRRANPQAYANPRTSPQPHVKRFVLRFFPRVRSYGRIARRIASAVSRSMM